MITFEPLWRTMKKQHISIYDLQEKYEFNGADIHRLKHNHNYTLKMLNRLCEILHCQPGDLIRYVPDEPNADQN